jgi:hypothetical protein
MLGRLARQSSERTPFGSRNPRMCRSRIHGRCTSTAPPRLRTQRWAKTTRYHGQIYLEGLRRIRCTNWLSSSAILARLHPIGGPARLKVRLEQSLDGEKHWNFSNSNNKTLMEELGRIMRGRLREGKSLSVR